MAKNNQKCVRMSDEILAIVEKCKGEGFNEKFENLVLDFYKSIPDREKLLKNYDQQINSKLEQLRQIEKRISGLKNFEFSLDSLRRNILNINQQADSIPVVSQSQELQPVPEGKNDIQAKNSRKKVI